MQISSIENLLIYMNCGLVILILFFIWTIFKTYKKKAWIKEFLKTLTDIGLLDIKRFKKVAEERYEKYSSIDACIVAQNFVENLLL